jgi:hypothetical protein
MVTGYPERMTNQTTDGGVCAWCLGSGKVCEYHPHKPEGHDGCTGAGMPCLNPETAHGRANLRYQERQRHNTEERHRLKPS